MKQLSIILLATILFASCKRKETLETDKNIVIMTDTSKAAGSYLSDTGLAKKPVAVAPVAAAVAPTRRTTSTRQRSRARYGNSTSTSTNNNSTVNNSGSGNYPTQPTRRRGISKAAKGAIIGGVGGAVIGGVIGKNAKGAIIGGAAGAAGGYILGRSKDRKDGRIP